MPLTWRNVAAPNFNPGSTLATAIRGFASAREGADAFTDQAHEFVDQENEYLTNEAIADALARGSFDPSSNRRVDSGAVMDALTAQERIESENLLQESTQEDIIRQRRENDPKNIKREEERIEAEHKARLREIEAREQEIDLRRRTLQAAAEEREAEQARLASVDEVDRYYTGLETKYVEESVARLPELVNAYLADHEFDPDNPQDVAALENEKRRIRRTLEQEGSLEFQRDFDSIIRDLPGRYTSDVLRDTVPGRQAAARLEALNKLTDTQSKEAADRRKIAEKNLTLARGNLDTNNPTGLHALQDAGDGNWVPMETDAATNRLNKGDISSTLSNSFGGYRPGSDADKKQAEEVLQLVGNNRQAFLQAVQVGFDQGDTGEGLFNLADDPSIDWREVKTVAGQMRDAMRQSARNFEFQDGPAELGSSTLRRKQPEGVATPGAEDEVVETDLSQRINDILGRDVKLDIHSSRDDTDPAVQRLERVIVELETLHRNGDGLPLSTQQLEDRREALLEIIKEVQKKSSRKSIGITGLENPVQPKI